MSDVIFIVLFVLSALIMSWAAYVSWKKEKIKRSEVTQRGNRIAELEKKVSDKSSALVIAKTEIKELKKNDSEDVVRIKQEKIEIETKLTQKKEELETKLDNFQSQLRQIKPKIEKKNNELEATQKRLTEITREKNELQAKLDNFQSQLRQLKPKIEKRNIDLQNSKALIASTKQENEKQLRKTETKYEVLKSTFDEQVNKKLEEFLNTPAYIPRFLYQLYKRRGKDFEKREEFLRRSEILNELQEKTNDVKEIQLLTKAEAIRLEIERSNHNIEVAFFNIEKRLDSFARDKQDFAHEKKLYEHDKNIYEHNKNVDSYERQKELDDFIRLKEDTLRKFDKKEEAIKRQIADYDMRLREDKHNQKVREDLHKLKVSLDKFNQEKEEAVFELTRKEEHLQRDIRDARHEHEKVSTQQGFKERELIIQERENMLKAHNKQTDLFFQEKTFELNKKEAYYTLEVAKGNLEADKKLQTIRVQLDEVKHQKKDLLFTEQKIQSLAREKRQEFVQREIHHKQQVLRSFYDQFHKDDPVTVDKAFTRLGYTVDSPLENENRRLREDLDRERQKNLESQN